VAARRVADGFIISLCVWAQVDWHRQPQAAAGGVIRWRGRDYESAGQLIDGDEAHPRSIRSSALPAAGRHRWLHPSPRRGRRDRSAWSVRLARAAPGERPDGSSLVSESQTFVIEDSLAISRTGCPADGHELGEGSDRRASPSSMGVLLFLWARDG